MEEVKVNTEEVAEEQVRNTEATNDESVVDEITDVASPEFVDVVDAMEEESQLMTEENEMQEPSQLEDDVQEIKPSVKCTVSDKHGVVIVGGHTSDGRGFVMKRISEKYQETPIIAIDGIAVIAVMCLDYKEDGSYDVVAGGYDNENCVCLVRINGEDFSIIKAVRISSVHSVISAISKFEDNFLVGGICGPEEGTKYHTPIISILDNDFVGTKVVIVKPEIPDFFDTSNVLIAGRITRIISKEDFIIISGFIRNDKNQGFGFISKIDSDFKPMKSCNVITKNSELTTIDNMWEDGEKFNIVGNTLALVDDDDPKVTGFIKVLDQELNIISSPTEMAWVTK